MLKHLIKQNNMVIIFIWTKLLYFQIFPNIVNKKINSFYVYWKRINKQKREGKESCIDGDEEKKKKSFFYYIYFNAFV